MAVTRGYFVDTVSGDSLLFQHNPMPIKDSQSQSLNILSIPSASQPRVTPGAPGARPITFKLMWSRETSDVEEVKRKVNWIKSLRYPHDGGSFQTYRAPIVLFVFGKFYKLACYLKKCDTVFDHHFEETTLDPWFASVDIELVEAPYSDILANMARRRGVFNAVR